MRNKPPTNRGRPLPWALRERIKELLAGGDFTVAAVAREVGVSRVTVMKYRPKLTAPQAAS